MIYDVMTLFPEMIESYCAQSMLKRGIESGLIKINTHNIRKYTKDKHKKTDDTPYGGGGGMVMTCQPVFDCYRSIKKQENFEFIILTPQGEKFAQSIAVELSQKEQIVFLCGHYEGYDERIRTRLNPREISIGDYVLTGGELGALVLIDSISRNIDGFLGCEKGAKDDSFSEGLNGLLEYPQYTKPFEYEGMKVPEILLSGNHQEIAKWRKEQSILRTQKRRKDLMN